MNVLVATGGTVSVVKAKPVVPPTIPLVFAIGGDLLKLAIVANALAESVIGLFKTEEIYRRGPWKGLEDVEFATLEWVAWYNHRRLLEPLGYGPPAEFEEAYYARQATPGGVAVLT